MSKKEALGSIPTFENVAKATEDLDLFNDATEPKKEEKNESKKDLEKELKEKMRKQVLEEAEAKRKKLNNEAKKSTKTITDEEIEATLEAGKKQNTDNNEQTPIKPSTKKGVRTGYKRQTFVIREDLLELIQALCNVNEIMQVDLLEAFIEKGLADISDDTKEKALASYRREQKQDKTEIAKKNVAKLFK